MWLCAHTHALAPFAVIHLVYKNRGGFITGTLNINMIVAVDAVAFNETKYEAYTTVAFQQDIVRHRYTAKIY